MPVGDFVPSLLHIDYPEWAAPLIGNIGQVWAYTGSGYAPVALDFDPSGTAALALGVSLVAGIDLRDIARWISALG